MPTFTALQTVIAFVTARLHRSDDGAAMVEYGLLLALIAVACVGAVTTLGTNVAKMFSDIAGSL